MISVDLETTMWAYLGAALLCAPALRALFGGWSSALTHRASDIILSREGVEIVGGRRNGLRSSWEQIDPKRSSLDDAVTGTVLAFLGATKYRRALFLAIDGDLVLIAESGDLAEDQALQAVLDAVHGVFGVVSEELSRKASTLAISCPACGAAAPAENRDSVTCAFCKATVPIPAEARRRLREASDRESHRPEVERATARVLAQAGGVRTNLFTLLAALACSVASFQAVGAVLAVSFFGLDPLVALSSFGFLAALALAWSLVAHAHVADRRGLRELLLVFTAHTDASGGAKCRGCTAPLAVTVGSLVATCSHCGVDNLMAPGVGPSAASLRHAGGKLEDVLAAVRGRRVSSFAGAALAIALACACAFFARG